MRLGGFERRRARDSLETEPGVEGAGWGRLRPEVDTRRFTDFGRGANVRLLTEIHEKTSHWPALVGADYADFRTGGLDCQTPNHAAIEYWRQGGLATISAHLYNPAREGGGGLRDKGVAISDLLAPDTPTLDHLL